MDRNTIYRVTFDVRYKGLTAPLRDERKVLAAHGDEAVTLARRAIMAQRFDDQLDNGKVVVRKPLWARLVELVALASADVS